MREPVDPFVGGELLHFRAAGPDPGDLRMPRRRRESLGVEVDPGTVRAVFRPVVRPTGWGQPPRRATCDPDRPEIALVPALTLDADIGERRTVRADAVQ